MSRSHSIARAVSALFLINIGTKLIGFLRDRAIAVIYGASGTTDAYLVAQTIPTLLTGALAGALGTAFLPVFADYMAQGREEEAWDLSSGILTNVLLLTIALSGAGVLLSEPIVRAFASGLSPESLELAVLSSQVLFPSILFAAVNAYLGGLLNSFKVFTAPALAPMVMNLVITAGIYLLNPLTGPLSLALASLVGTAVQLLVQIPNLHKVKFRFRPKLGWQTPGIRRVAHLTWPVLLGAGLTQVYTLVDRFLASYLSEGSISALNFAIKVLQLPLGLFVAAISTVLFPTFAELHSRHEGAQLAAKVESGIRSTALFILPAFVLLGLLRIPVIQILFQKGAFDYAATEATALALLCYLGAGIAQSYTTVINTAMFAMQKTLVSVIINAIGTAVNIGLDLVLVKPLGFAGLALANSAASLVITALSFAVIRRHIPELSVGRIAVNTGKFLLATTIMALGVHFALSRWVTDAWLLSTPGRLKMLMLGAGTALPLYLLTLLPLRVPEVTQILKKLKR